jgi:hypothetical protein
MKKLKKLKYLKPYHTFEIRSGVKPMFDKGDVVTNGVHNILVTDITSASDNKAYYSVISPENTICHNTLVKYQTISLATEYHTFNKNFILFKKGDLKTKYALCNGCNFGIENVISSDDIIKMALGEKSWHPFFEESWLKEWKGQEPQDIYTKNPEKNISLF